MKRKEKVTIISREVRRGVLGIRFSVRDSNGKEVGRACLYILRNDLHQKPFAFLEDVFIASQMRGKGIGSRLIKEVIKKVKENDCYKLMATSRYSRRKVHQFYENLGFKKRGFEFRINFPKKG